MNSRPLDRLLRSVRAELRRDREASYRRALKRVGFEPQTIDVLVDKDREWIERGR